MILIDLSSILYSSLHALPSDVTEGMLRHFVLNTIRSYNLKYRDRYGQMVIACDAGNVWRKDIFPNYKANRKEARETREKDWDEIFRIFVVIRNELRDFIPCKLVWVDRCEADDIIATIVESTQEFGCFEDVMIISADGDYAQLQRYSNVKQFSPRTQKLMGEADPVGVLRKKIIKGDPGDGVPNILSHENSFVDGVRQKNVSSKRLNEILTNWNNLGTFLDPETLRRFRVNESLIDLSKIPEDRKTEILNAYRNTVIPSNKDVFSYLIAKRCGQLAGSASDFFTK